MDLSELALIELKRLLFKHREEIIGEEKKYYYSGEIIWFNGR